VEYYIYGITDNFFLLFFPRQTFLDEKNVERFGNDESAASRMSLGNNNFGLPPEEDESSMNNSQLLEGSIGSIGNCHTAVASNSESPLDDSSSNELQLDGHESSMNNSQFFMEGSFVEETVPTSSRQQLDPESSMGNSQLFLEGSFDNGSVTPPPSDEASFTLDEVMNQESMTNCYGEDDAAAAAMAVADNTVEVAEPATWTSRITNHLRKLWNETEDEMEALTNSVDQMSSSFANESSRNMAGAFVPGKTQLYVLLGSGCPAFATLLCLF
jgi:hypothetical protein